MAVEQRRMKNGNLVWYSTMLNDYSERQGELLEEERKEIHRRKCNTEDAVAAEWAKVSIEDHRAFLMEEERKAAAEQATHEQLKLISNFVRDNPWLVNDLHNRDVISERIAAVVEKTGRQYADWGEHDFALAIDAAADDGVLHTNGPYVRQAPDVDAMTADEIQGLAYEQSAGIRRRTIKL